MKRVVVIAALGLALAGCGSSPAPSSPSGSASAVTSAATTSPGTTAPAGLPADHVLLAVDDASGWPGSAGIEDRRAVTLLADGTLIARAPGAASLLPVAMTRLDPAALDDAWAEVAASGVAVDGSFALPGIYDANTVTFAVDDGARATRLSIYALGMGPIDGSFQPGEGRLRADARSLLTSLQGRAQGEPWTPPALLLWSVPSDGSGSGAAPRTVPWTVDVDLATAGVPVDNPVYARCVRVEGEVAAAVADLVRPLVPDVAVEQRGVRYAIAVRPIYADELDEVDCPR